MAHARRIALDSSAVIALSEGKRTARAFVNSALRAGASIFVPAPVLAEITRGNARDAGINHVVKAFEVPVVDEAVAREAGAMLLAKDPRLTLDALICATAIHHGADALVTQDPADHTHFAAGKLRVLSVA